MRCAVVRDLLMEYVSCELPPQQGAEISAHLAACPACRKVRDAASAATEALSLLTVEHEAPQLIADVRRRLTRRQRVTPLALAAGLSVLLVVIAAASWLQREPELRQTTVAVPRTTSPRAAAPREPVQTAAKSTPRVVVPAQDRHVRKPQVVRKPVMMAQLPPEATSDGRAQTYPEIRGNHLRIKGNFSKLYAQLDLGRRDRPNAANSRHWYVPEGKSTWDYSWDESTTPQCGYGIDGHDGDAGNHLNYYSRDMAEAGLDGQGEPAEVRTAKLGQIALLVLALSDDGSRLLIGQGASANPQGLHFRAAGWEELPTIMAYPASAPVAAALPIGDCVLVGAVATTTFAYLSDTADLDCDGITPMAPPGVYLLAYNGPLSDNVEELGTMSLMSVAVDDKGEPVYQQTLTAPAKRYTRPSDVFYGGEDWYGASVRFSDENPRRVDTMLALHEPDGRYRSYSFSLDLQLIFK